LFRAPFHGSVTTVRFSTGVIISFRYPMSRSARTAPSTCQGWEEQEGKYFVQDRFSLMRVGRSLERVSPIPAVSARRT
jgi:hypothetical protein